VSANAKVTAIARNLLDTFIKPTGFRVVLIQQCILFSGLGIPSGIDPTAAKGEIKVLFELHLN